MKTVEKLVLAGKLLKEARQQVVIDMCYGDWSLYDMWEMEYDDRLATLQFAKHLHGKYTRQFIRGE